MKKHLIFLLCASVLMLSGCVSSKKLQYFQDTDDEAMLNSVYSTNYDLTIQPGDRLTIKVTSKSKDLLEPFASSVFVGSTTNGSMTTDANAFGAGLLVEEDGTIHVPVIGRVAVQGLTHVEAEELLKEKIIQSRYVLDPDVAVAISNFRFLVLGAVNTPGVKTSANERLTLHEALALAGDVKITGLRENVKIMRTVDGEVKTYIVNLTSEEDVMRSPAYYIKQNDVVYVQSNKAENVDASPAYKYMTAILTFVSFFTAVSTLVIALTKN